MNDTNQVILTGRTGKEVELRYTPKGVAIASISLAVNESWTGDDGQKREKVNWVNLVAFNKTAELCARYLGKGSQILAQGKLQFETWDDRQTGQKRTSLKVNLQRVQFLDTKPVGGADQPPARGTAPSQRTPPVDSAGDEPPQGDDVPF